VDGDPSPSPGRDELVELCGTRQRHGTCSIGMAAMINQDECHYERHASSERQDRPLSGGAVAELDRQVRDTVEALKLKVENLRLFLSWRK
jgi:hypothetical protein